MKALGCLVGLVVVTYLLWATGVIAAGLAHLGLWGE